uniref:Putative microtubule-associated protein futsch isoform x2 n=1 Tax=Phlebotomus kandelakii TaxID=1109342 RepID=A0A6B2EAW4_9DIPT
MPAQKHKVLGKIQPKQEVEKVKVKSEPIDILPLSEYVDDRVELIKQAFQCLKPKSIKAIAPDFLQTKPIEKIQEQCLNEVLGMSKKRLLAIINATKCPTDTESSSDEETVKPIEEHISLDEISSEDERPKGGKKRQKKIEKKEERKPAEKKKEYSVLELLELQARARAIRSQLALEPVTKIEIKESDEEEQVEEQPPKIKPPVQPSTPAPAKSTSSSSSQSSAKPSSPRTMRVIKSTVTDMSKSKEKTKNKVKESNKNGLEHLERNKSSDEPQKATVRRIKLKRNWRKRSQVGDGLAQDNPSNLVIVVKNTAVQIQPEPEEERERSGSPDVLPIVPSPETLCISSDTDEEIPAKEKHDEKIVKETPVVPEKEPSPPMEFTEESKRDEALEEGEVLDELELTIHEDDENLEAVIAEKPPQVEKKNTDEEDKRAEKSDEENVETDDKEKPTTEEEKEVTEEDKSDDELNDDCIEIECTDILEDHQENTDQKDESDTQNKTEPEEEILELDDSSDEDNLPLSQLVGEKGSSPSKVNNSKIESWNSRWLESSRVSKIMATSRLANTVRRKIKTKGKKQKETDENDTNSAEEAQVKVPESSAEVGSVEHFHELAEKQQQE